MKWKKRQREIKRLRAAHAGRRWRAPFPDLATTKSGVAPCSNILDLYGMEVKEHHPPPEGLVVDHFHKSGLQVVLPSELPWAGGKKP
jgi:hypothetical protein